MVKWLESTYDGLEQSGRSIHIMVAKHGASDYLPTFHECAIKIAQFCSSMSNYIYIYIYHAILWAYGIYIYIYISSWNLELVSEPLHHVHHGRSQISTVLLGTEHRLGWMPKLQHVGDLANKNVGKHEILQTGLDYTRWCPSSLAKLVYNSHFTMVYGRYNYS